MKRSAHYWFININIAIPDFQVETAFRIGAYPGFVLNVGSLAAKIGQRHKVSGFAALTFGEIRLFHEVHLPARYKNFYKYTPVNYRWQDDKERYLKSGSI